jgi:hypothetical protein
MGKNGFGSTDLLKIDHYFLGPSLYVSRIIQIFNYVIQVKDKGSYIEKDVFEMKNKWCR